MDELCDLLYEAENDRLAYVDTQHQAMQLTKPRGGKRAQAPRSTCKYIGAIGSCVTLQNVEPTHQLPCRRRWSEMILRADLGVLRSWFSPRL